MLPVVRFGKRAYTRLRWRRTRGDPLLSYCGGGGGGGAPVEKRIHSATHLAMAKGKGGERGRLSLWREAFALPWRGDSQPEGGKFPSEERGRA